jgi:phosphomannomutase
LDSRQPRETSKFKFMKRCSGTLRSNLSYEPVELQFGTSGRRGEVAHLTQLEVYINALAELEYLQTLPREQGGIVPGDAFYFAHDLRPSSSRYVIEQDGRGELAQAVVQAIHDSKMRPVNLGKIPTPALTHYALSCACGSIMVTGSHIPFDRNGYKTNSARGELRKEDEGPINERVGNVRRRLYSGPYNESIFNERGLFKSGPRVLPPESDRGRKAYLERYAEFYSGCSLSGRRLLVYEHSAVGRDLLVELLDHIGAEVIPAGRSDRFVPIDTENIGREQLAAIQALARQVLEDEQPIFALVSTDGDSDRPLILGHGSTSGG